MTTPVERCEQIVIERPAAAVWAALADFGSIAGWASNVDHSCLLSEQVEGVGAVRRVQAARATLVETLVTWEPERTLAYTIAGLPPALGTITNTWKLDPMGRQTSVSLTTSIDAGKAPPKRLLAKGLLRPLGSASVQMLRGLKSHVEEVSE